MIGKRTWVDTARIQTNLNPATQTYTSPKKLLLLYLNNASGVVPCDRKECVDYYSNSSTSHLNSFNTALERAA